MAEELPNLPRTGVNSYARQLLRETHVRVFSGANQILEPKIQLRYDLDALGEYNPGFYVGELYAEVESTKIVQSYEDLKNIGAAIVSDTAPTQNFTQQRVQYILVKYVPGMRAHSGMPTGHYVEYDVNNRRLRLIGRNAGPRNTGPWMYLKGAVTDNKRGPYKPAGINAALSRAENFSIDKALRKMTNIPEEPAWISLPDLPIAITEDGRLLCIPQLPDQPTIGFLGQRRTGKSYMMHSLVDRAFWHKDWDVRIAIMSDSQPETMTWTKPNIAHEPMITLRQYGEAPRPMPCVYLHPHLSTMTPEDVIHPKEAGYEISLPFKEIVNNYSKYMDLKGSTKYFHAVKDDLLRAQDMEDVIEIVDDQDRIKPQQSREMIMHNLQMFFADDILDITCQIPAAWRVESKDMNEVLTPMAACIAAGVIPILVTNKLLSTDWFPQYFTYFVEDIFQRQTSPGIFKDKNMRLWLVIDEAQNVSSTEVKTVANTILNRCVREGGPKRIGTLVSTQSYSKLAYSIRSNLKYLFAFCNPTEANKISSDFNLGSYWAGVIKALPKHWCVAYTTEKFAIYDRDGKKTFEQGPFRCKSLPTLSLHKAPDKEND